MPDRSSNRYVAAFKPWLDLVVSICLITASVVIIYRGFGSTSRGARPTTPVPQEIVPISGPTLGAPDAPVVMMIFSDFQCPFCKSFATQVFPSIKVDYVQKNRLQVVFRHMTPPNHPFSARAAAASECADRQGRFWEMHDVLFEKSPQLESARLEEYAQSATLEPTGFQSCLATETVAKRIRDDNAMAERLAITGTPAFLIGVREGAGVRVRKVVSGAKPLAEFQRAIEGIK
jgi:protein-disulfide isomerase